jgi:hypothetical protein
MMFYPWVIHETTQPVPVGLAHFMELTWMSETSSFHILRACFFGLLFCYISGAALAVITPLLLLAHLLPYTLMNSQGHPHHGYQILSLALLGITAVSCWLGRSTLHGARSTAVLVLALLSGYIWQSWMASTARSTFATTCINSFGVGVSSWLILIIEGSAFCLIGLGLAKLHSHKTLPALRSWHLFAAQWMGAATYFVSVCSKMRESDWGWFARSHFIVLDMVKSTRQSYYSALDPALKIDPPAIHFFMEHQNLTRIFFSSGVILETLIILAVGTRKLALCFGLLVILMHRSIEALMTLNFHTNEAVLALFFVNLPYWISRWTEAGRLPTPA